MGNDSGNVHETRAPNGFSAEIAVHGPPHRTRVKDDARISLSTSTSSANRKIRRDNAGCQNRESQGLGFHERPSQVFGWSLSAAIWPRPGRRARSRGLVVAHAYGASMLLTPRNSAYIEGGILQSSPGSNSSGGGFPHTRTMLPTWLGSFPKIGSDSGAPSVIASSRRGLRAWLVILIAVPRPSLRTTEPVTASAIRKTRW